jgi:hypothetical protein
MTGTGRTFFDRQKSTSDICVVLQGSDKTTRVGTAVHCGGDPFPSHCQQRDLTPQEKLLEFMLFDVSSCLLEDSRAPETPGR